jgi:inosine-uridine nucleoside N-ribohydrolase
MTEIDAAGVIIDTDIGFDIDDAFALAMAIKGGLKIKGISTVSGDTLKRGRIAKKMLVLAGMDRVPVFAGVRSRALSTYDRWVDVSEVLDVRQDLEGMIEHYWHEIDHVRNGRLQLVAIGPLSNIALVRERDEVRFDDRVKLLMMGGQFKKWLHGLSLHLPEYNVLMDKDAARAIIASRVPTRIVPFDVTVDIEFTRQDMSSLQAISGKDSMIQALVQMTSIFQSSLFGHRSPIMFDPATLVPLFDPTILSFKNMQIELTKGGFTRVPKKVKPWLIEKEVCIKLDMERLYDLLFTIFIGKPRQSKTVE